MKIKVAVLLAGYVTVAAAQDGITGQQAAVAAMQDSIARQQASVAVQRSKNMGSFFVLPPPQPMPGSGLGLAEMACAPLPDNEVRSLVTEAATREGVDTALLLSVMRQESGFRPCAVSKKGAMGLMQLMPDTAGDLGVKDCFDPRENVTGGARFLHQLLNRYNGDVVKALGAYNAGPARVDAVDGIPDIPETMDYVKNILLTNLEN
ncbi:MAG TPA: lytic transglycosylase domain-containing protein [Bryobacteraceae bacterium]|nr:lytic transglycosylase domain-containing protein [Bryobacteraceae bacterium]